MQPDTRQFLSLFPGRHTFQTFADKKDHNSGMLARVTPDLKEVARLNKIGAGAFLMINEGDGAGRSNENVVKVRAYFADFDGQPLPKTWPLEPSAIVESSEGRFHAYWLVASAPLDNVNFNATQEAIARAVGSQIADCKGLARVMRLPGFQHLKHEPFTSRLMTAPGTVYDVADVRRAFPVASPVQEPLPAYVAPQTRDERPSPQKIMEIVLRNADLSQGRNNLAFKLACQIRDNGWPQYEAESVLREYQGIVAGHGDEPFTLAEAMHAAAQAYRKPPREPWQSKPRQFQERNAAQIGKSEQGTEEASQKAKGPTLSELRDVFLDWCAEQGHIYKYHQLRRSWWQYQTGVYVEVLDEVMLQRADKVLQSKGFLDLKTNYLAEVLAKVGREEAVAALEVDMTAMQLNVTNGILRLQTGELLEHSPEYFSTIQSAAAFRPEAQAHEWLAFLHEAVPDAADRKTLQQFAGYCLTGDTSAQRALLLIGEGGTGKSTYTRVLAAVLGSLATGSALENIKDGSFLVGNLVGKRMCVVSELQRNVDWLPFKRITGEDKITVDVKNKTPFTVKLDIKLVILSNVVPFLGDDATNSSLMRRFLPVAFNVKPAEPDPALEARLTHPDELAGVLNWMLDGLRSLQANNMRFPAGNFGRLGQEIVEESNKVIEFLRERTAPGGEVKSADLYRAYSAWCAETNHRTVSSTRFPKDLIAAAAHFGQKVSKDKNRDGALFIGVRLSGAGNWDFKTEECDGL